MIPQLSVLLLLQQAPDLVDFTKKVNAFTSGQPPIKSSEDRAQFNERLKAYLAGQLASVQETAIPAKDAAGWAGYYEQAGLKEPATRLQVKGLTFHNQQIMFTTGDLVSKLVAEGKDEDALFVLRRATNLEASGLGFLSDFFFGACTRAGYTKTKLKFVDAGLSIITSKIDRSTSALFPRVNAMVDYLEVDLGMKSLEMHYAQNPSDKIIAQMKALRSRFANSKDTNALGQSPASRVDGFLGRLEAVGSNALEVTFQQSIGTFKGLASLRGKVVLLDFMAHWCGPCKAALPGIKKLSEEYGSAFQVVSVTSFYGYYGATKDVTPAKEFELMHDFVKQYGMNWPVVFDVKQDTQARYKVNGIPHLVLIDKTGKVNKVIVGFTPESEADLAARVKKLVSQG